jgi:NAD(P)-dependent dehydrogenase (short-subunit alcohol dehydrogenase family)
VSARGAAGTRAVVTGAASGLGRAFVIELVSRGARVVAGDINDAGLAETAQLAGGEVHVIRCDVTRLPDVEALAAAADARLGGVDLVINNAGVAVGGRVGEVTLDDWRFIVDVNLWGVVYGCHVFAPRLRAQRSGAILNVASIAGLLSPPGIAPYNVTKAGVVALSETLAAELVDDHVRVAVLCPSFFATNIAKSARGTSDPKMLATVERMMANAKLDARGVARSALDGLARNHLYVLPMRDARWLWRLKRTLPFRFARLAGRIAARLAPK